MLRTKRSDLGREALVGGSNGPRSPHFRLDEKGSVPETLRYESRVDMRSLGELTDLTFPAADEDSAAAGPRSSQQVRYAVSNHVAFQEGYPQILSCLLEQANLRLVATAALPEFEHFCLRMMQAVIDPINMPTGRANSRKHSAIERLQHCGL